jgi:hypothetical protein
LVDGANARALADKTSSAEKTGNQNLHNVAARTVGIGAPLLAIGRWGRTLAIDEAVWIWFVEAV